MARVDRLFLACVAVPTVLATVYFGFFASDVYVSESRFVVRSPDKPATSGLGIILKSAGFSSASEEAFAAQSYVRTRDALRLVNAKGEVKAAYTRPTISIFNRFDPIGLSGSFEDLYNYYLGKVSVADDPATSISTLTVKAYTPQDAQRLNERLLEGAEALVNRLNERGRQDLIVSAESEAATAQARARRASAEMSRYRNSSQILDPEKQAQVQLMMVSKLQDEMIASQAQLQQLRSVAPDNPQVGALQQKIALLQRQIAVQTGAVAGAPASLATKAARYEQLRLESEFASKQLASAMASLETARNEAARKQAYVERIAQPNLPDDALEPRRLRAILSTFLLGLVAWGVVSMLVAGVREHSE